MPFRVTPSIFSVMLLVASSAPAATAAQQQDDEAGYHPTPLQLRVDASFSNIPMETRLSAARDRLGAQPSDCDPALTDECILIDGDGITHTFFDDANQEVLVIKYVRAADVEDRSISAFGIGSARTQAEVLANVRTFLGRDAQRLDCNRRASGNVGPVECEITLGPGWAQIGFTTDGQLQAVRFDAYHFM